MTREEKMYTRSKYRFIDYLKITEYPFWEPAQTLCPHCYSEANIISGSRWICKNCHSRGDFADFVMNVEHLDSRINALEKICLTLNIKVNAIDVISANELMDMQLERPDMIVENLLGQGVYLLAGPGKIGKSLLMLLLSHCVSTGENFLDFRTMQKDVLYFSLEDTRERIQERESKITQGETGRIFFSTECDLIGKGFEENLIDFITECPTIGLVVIDTLQKARQHSSYHYSYSSDYELIGRLKNIADKYGLTILLVHHTRKTWSPDPFSMISGTTGLSGSADGLFVLLKDLHVSNMARLYTTGRDIPTLELELTRDKTSGIWKFIGYAEKEPNTTHERLLYEISNLLDDIESFNGTASELMELITSRCDIEIKSPNALTRQLNPYKSLLEAEFGIIYNTSRSGSERTINLHRLDGWTPQ